jgi:hypothetical protein
MLKIVRALTAGVAVALALCCSATSPNAGGNRSCTTCRGPVHSWDTLPVSIHWAISATDARGGFSADQLAVLAKAPLVTIEKWQGSAAVDSATGAPVFLWEEDAWAFAAGQIKVRARCRVLQQHTFMSAWRYQW